MERITSRKNPLLEHIRRLDSGPYRRQCGAFLCDSPKLVDEALRHGVTVTCVVVSDGVALPEHLPEGVRCVSVPADVMASLSPQRTPQGMLAVCALSDTAPPATLAPGRYIVLDGVQDPGNVGTVLRTLDAAGFDGCILTPGCADPFGPKALRATMGSVFRVPVCCVGNTVETVQALNARGYATLAAALDGENFYRRAPLPARLCVLIGNEGAGLTKQAQDACTHRFRLPMRGGAESLNAAVAAAVMMYDLINRE